MNISNDVKGIGLMVEIKDKRGRSYVRKEWERHGIYKSKLYYVWYGMKTRCYDEKSSAYKNYGGRGIKICDSWAKDIKSFYEWAIENGYSEGLTLERIDNSGEYSPNNCRWATRKEQANNVRRNLRITYQDETLTAPQWAERFGININTLKKRYFKGLRGKELFAPADKRYSRA